MLKTYFSSAAIIAAMLFAATVTLGRGTNAPAEISCTGVTADRLSAWVECAA